MKLINDQIQKYERPLWDFMDLVRNQQRTSILDLVNLNQLITQAVQ